MSRRHVRTIRLQENDVALIDKFLEQNQSVNSFSALARVATLTFITERETMPIQPVGIEVKRPPFLWDYDMTKAEVRAILSEPGLNTKKKWLIERIINEGKFSEIMSYLNLSTIRKIFGKLKLKPTNRKYWAYALKVWK